MVAVDYDVLIIGSGFGGSVSALRLAEKGYRVGVLEAGKRYAPKDFPTSNWQVRKFLWFPRLGMRGIQRLTLLKDILVLSGAGVGGGSLVYANTLYEPHDAYYSDPTWADVTDWKAELAPWYAMAKRMLGVNDFPGDTPADGVIRHIAGHFGVEDTYRSTPIGVYLGAPGETVPDPYFGGVGPDRAGCTSCGGCMVGCRFNAKNSLDRNYLFLAERAGAAVHAEHQVVDIERTASGGFLVTTERPGAWIRKRRRTFAAGQVIMAAGALGTTRLLLQLRERGHLPGLSDRLGHRVLTNSESLIGAQALGTEVDYSQGPAITSSIHTSPDTHIEPVRYPKGSNVMGLLATILVDGGGRIPRQLRFLKEALRRPVSFVRSLSVRNWAERTVILLVMQSRDNSLRVFLNRRGRLTSEQGHGEPNPTYLPEGNEAARVGAAFMGGEPGSAINEVLLDTPTTAHILGGANVAGDPERGVIDPYHRVFGEPGLHVVDGAAIGGNLGVNPSLTITALAERAISFWPNKGDDDARPVPGRPYEQVAPVPPASPTVPTGVLGMDPWSH